MSFCDPDFCSCEDQIKRLIEEKAAIAAERNQMAKELRQLWHAVGYARQCIGFSLGLSQMCRDTESWPDDVDISQMKSLIGKVDDLLGALVPLTKAE